MNIDPTATFILLIAAYRYAHKLQITLHDLFSSSGTADESWLALAEDAEVFERKLGQVMRLMQRVLDQDSTSPSLIPQALRVREEA